MKKILALVLALVMMICATAAFADGIALGQVEYAAHGTPCFAVLTVAVEGDTIIAAHINEYQFMDAATAVGVPNSDASFGENFPEGKVLASKVVNNELYSGNMATKAGATKQLGEGYATIEAFVTGKTVEELEVFVATQTKESVLDAVSGCTLVDTLGYIKGLLAAAKTVAADQTGVYTVYNKTGETVTEVTITINETGEQTVVATDVAADAMLVIPFTMTNALNGHGALTFGFKTEGGYEAAFERLSIETAPITMLSLDALTGATPISFFAPAAE